jgi:hypothetical protein
MDTTIYMPLIGEGTDVWRPVTAEELGDRRYRVVGRRPTDEEWAFVTGAIVVVDTDRRITSHADA